MESGYIYNGEQTCAADGMCQVKCPVGINTGELVKEIRAEQLNAASKSSGYGIAHVSTPFPVLDNSCTQCLNQSLPDILILFQ